MPIQNRRVTSQVRITP